MSYATLLDLYEDGYHGSQFLVIIVDVLVSEVRAVRADCSMAFRSDTSHFDSECINLIFQPASVALLSTNLMIPGQIAIAQNLYSIHLVYTFICFPGSSAALKYSVCQYGRSY